MLNICLQDSPCKPPKVRLAYPSSASLPKHHYLVAGAFHVWSFPHLLGFRSVLTHFRCVYSWNFHGDSSQRSPQKASASLACRIVQKHQNGKQLLEKNQALDRQKIEKHLKRGSTSVPKVSPHSSSNRSKTSKTDLGDHCIHATGPLRVPISLYPPHLCRRSFCRHSMIGKGCRNRLCAYACRKAKSTREEDESSVSEGCS
jgi:hypothetical protein